MPNNVLLNEMTEGHLKNKRCMHRLNSVRFQLETKCYCADQVTKISSDD